MSKALIEKAFEKFMLDKFGIEAKNIDIKAWNIYKDNFDYAWNKGATWQREQLEAEILNKEKSWYAEFPDEKSAQEVFNIIKELQTKNKTIREQLIKELREWIESNKELRGYTGIPDDTLNIILAKLDELEGEK
jgi:hypothetical protein